MYTPLPLLLPFPLEVSLPVLASAPSLLSAFSNTELANGMPSDGIAVVNSGPRFLLNECYPRRKNPSGKRVRPFVVLQSSDSRPTTLSTASLLYSLSRIWLSGRETSELNGPQVRKASDAPSLATSMPVGFGTGRNKIRPASYTERMAQHGCRRLADAASRFPIPKQRRSTFEGRAWNRR